MNSEVKQLNEIKETSIKTEGYKEGHGTKEWSNVSINIAKGCYHNCGYCYARKIATRYRADSLEAKNWE